MKTRSLTVLFTIIALLFTLGSCSGSSEKKVEVDFSGKYALIRPDFEKIAPLDAFLYLNRNLTERGAQVTIKTDFLSERQNEQPGQFELLFGPTERAESEAALAEYTLSELEYLIKLVGDKIVVLAGSENAYIAAADYLLEAFDPSSGRLALPEAAHLGRWIPKLEGLSIDGIPIGDFTIVADDILDRELMTYAEELSELIYQLSGNTLRVESDESDSDESDLDESDSGAHEIILCSDSVNRKLPEGKRGAFTDGGKLYLHASTKAEHEHLIKSFIATFLSEESKILNITTEALNGGITMNNPTAEAVRAAGNDAKARGEALAKAAAIANTKLQSNPDKPTDLTIELVDGEYFLTEPLVIENNSFSSLTIKAAKGANPVITGAVSIPDSAWKKVEGKEYYSAKLDSDIKVRDLYFDGKRIPIAVSESYKTVLGFENTEKKDDPANAKGLYVDKRILEGIDELSYPTEYTIYVEWEFNRLHVTGVDLSDTKTVDGVELVRLKLDEEQMMYFSQNNHTILSIINREYFLGNNVAFLKPGTCVCDYENNVVYYYPESGAPKSVTYSTLEQLISLKNASNVSFEGISFTGTASRLSAQKGYQSGQANTEKREGVLHCAAVLTDSCTNISFDSCTFSGLGGNGILSVNLLNGVSITNCAFDDVAMSAISLGNHNTAWDADNANYRFVIDNNRIENIGFEYPTATAIYISHVDGLKLTNNTIHNVAYSGISLGWGWTVVGYQYGEKINVRGAELAYNHITDFMMKLKDGAAIYVLGANCTTEYTEYFNEMHHNYAKNPNKLHRGYYLDGSASNWYVHDNVISGALYPLFTQFHVVNQYNHNVKCERIYSTDTIDKKNNAPDRNVILGDTFTEVSLEAIYAKYPEAKEIMENAGIKKK